MADSALQLGTVTRRVPYRVTTAGVVAATLYVLDGSVGVAVGSAALFLGFVLAGDILEAVVGPYADHVFMGLVALGFTATIAVTDPWPPLLIAGTVVGGWLVIDGVQHLRYGETRESLSGPASHDGHAVTGILRVLLARVLEPFRLGE